LKQELKTLIDSEVLAKFHKYAVVKLNSESKINEEALKEYLKNNPIHERKELPVLDLIKKGPLGTFLKPREKRKLVSILKDEHVYNHKRGGCLIPSYERNNLYYVVSGIYFERRELSSSHGPISMNQDLISEDEIFGEEFITDDFPSHWETPNGGRILRIPCDVKNELIRKIPKIKDNIEYLISQKFKKMDYISTIRNNHLSSEDKVKYSFDFLVQNLGQTMNGDSSKREVSMPFNGHHLQMGHYSDYGVLKRIMYEEIAELVSLTRESVSRVLNRTCFNLNGNNFRIGFLENKQLYIFKDLLNEEGKIIKLRNIRN